MSKKLYAERDIEGLDEDGNFYFKHIMAMTAESLHGKSAIAAELGYRDSKIVELQAKLEAAMTERDSALAQNAELVAEREDVMSKAFKIGFFQAKQVYKCELGYCATDLDEMAQEYIDREVKYDLLARN